MEIWITKYALTLGIKKITIDKIGDNNMISVREEGHRYDSYYHKGEYFDNEDDAINKAKDMQQRKIKSLKKSLEKVSELKFIKGGS